MGIVLAWEDQEQSVIRVDYSGRWTWEDFFEGITHTVEMMDSVSGRVDIIENMKPGVLPVSGSAINAARNGMRSFSDNLGLVVVVVNPYVRAIGTIFVNLNSEYRERIRMVDTIEQARAMISEQRAKNMRT